MCSGCVLSVFRVCTVFVQSVFRVCSECVQCVFRVCSECVQSVFRVCSECVQSMFNIEVISSPSASSVSIFGIFYERQLKLMVIMQMISFVLSAERLKERHRMQMSQSYYRQNELVDAEKNRL